jgi:small subunit ribosomal protein S9
MAEKEKKVVKKEAKAKSEKVTKPAKVVAKKDSPVPTVLKVPTGSAYGTGKRKTSIARVWVFPGSGTIEINGQSLSEYLPTDIEVKHVVKPLAKLGLESSYDVKVSVVGGGLIGQAGAAQHGIARALLLVNPEFRKALKEDGFLTRDPRVKERKKYGRKRARKGFQFRKR